MPRLEKRTPVFLLLFCFALDAAVDTPKVWIASGPITHLVSYSGEKWLAGQFVEEKNVPLASRLDGRGKWMENATPRLSSSWVTQSIAARPVGGVLIAVLHRATGATSLRRFGSDGAHDVVFERNAAAALGDTPRAALGAFTVDAADRTYVVTIDKSDPGHPRSRLRRLLPSGERDESFRPTPDLSHYHFLRAQNDGSIMAAGSGFVRYLSDGKLDVSFQVPTEIGNVVRFAPSPEGGWVAIETQPPQTRYDLDDLGQFKGAPLNLPRYQPTPWRAVRLAKDGKRDPKFTSAFEWGGLPSSVAVSKDGSILVAGSVVLLKTPAVMHHGVWINAKGKIFGKLPIPKTSVAHLPASASPDGTLLLASAASRASKIEKRAATGKLVSATEVPFLVTALFADENGTWLGRREETSPKTSPLAKWDGTTIDADFSANAADASPKNVQFLARLPDGRLLVAAGDEMTTSFQQKPLRLEITGTSIVGTIVRIEPDGTRDPDFTLDETLSGTINAISVSPQGRIALVGQLATSEGSLKARQAVLVLTEKGRVDREWLKSSTLLSAPGRDASWREDGGLIVALATNAAPLLVKPDGKIESVRKDPSRSRTEWNDFVDTTSAPRVLCATGTFEFGSTKKESLWTSIARYYHGFQLALAYSFAVPQVRFAEYNEREFRWAMFNQILSGRYSGFGTQPFKAEGTSPLGRFGSDGDLDVGYARQVASIPALQGARVERAAAADDGTVFALIAAAGGSRQEILKLRPDGTQDPTYPVFGAERSELRLLGLDPGQGVWLSGKFQDTGRVHGLALIPIDAGSPKYFLEVK